MISIIIPTLNEEGNLAAQLSKLAAGLTAYEYEIIISDSGSTDRTAEIGRQFGTVLEYREPGRKTIAWGRNRGAAAAHGEFLVFMDATVEIPAPNEFFGAALRRFAADPKLLALAPAIRIFPEIETATDVFWGTFFNYLFWFKNNILGQGGAPGKFQMIGREAFEAAKGYREDLVTAEDLDMFARLSKKGRTRLDLGLTAYYNGRRIHAVGWTKLMWIWWKNWLAYTFLNHSATKDWYLGRK